MLLAESQRLLPRPLILNNLSSLAPSLSDPEGIRYSVKGVHDEDATREFIEWCLGSNTSHSAGPWALIDKNFTDLIGFCGVGPEIVTVAEELNLGYRLTRNYWGRGLATESVTASLQHTFSQTDNESVVVIIVPEYKASLRVSQNAGFSEYRLVNSTHGWSGATD